MRPAGALLAVAATTSVIMLPLSIVTTGRLSTLYAGMAICLSCSRWLTSPEQVDRFLGIFGVGSTIVAVCVASVATDWLENKWLPTDGLVRAMPLVIRPLAPGQGTTQGGVHPNELAGFIVLALPATILLLRSNGWNRVVGILCGGLLFGLLVFTQSRAGLLGVASIISVFVVWRGTRSSGALRVALIGGPVFGLVLFFWLLFRSWSDIPIGPFNSLASRLALWERVLLVVRDFPLTGVGPGQLSTVVQRFYPTALIPMTEYLPHAHNLVLEMAAEIGVFGAASVVWLLGGLVIYLCKAVRSSEQVLAPCALSIVASIVGFSSYSLVDAISLTGRGAISAWIIFGVAGSVVLIQQKSGANQLE